MKNEKDPTDSTPQKAPAPQPSLTQADPHMRLARLIRQRRNWPSSDPPVPSPALMEYCRSNNPGPPLDPDCYFLSGTDLNGIKPLKNGVAPPLDYDINPTYGSIDAPTIPGGRVALPPDLYSGWWDLEYVADDNSEVTFEIGFVWPLDSADWMPSGVYDVYPVDEVSYAFGWHLESNGGSAELEIESYAFKARSFWGQAGDEVPVVTSRPEKISASAKDGKRDRGAASGCFDLGPPVLDVEHFRDTVPSTVGPAVPPQPELVIGRTTTFRLSASGAARVILRIYRYGISLPLYSNRDARAIDRAVMVYEKGPLPPKLVSLKVAPPGPTIARGQTLQMTALGAFNDGSTPDLTAQVSWTSADQNVVLVSDDPASKGLVTANNFGSTTIAATLNGVVGETNVLVPVPDVFILSPPRQFSLVDAHGELGHGGSFDFAWNAVAGLPDWTLEYEINISLPWWGGCLGFGDRTRTVPGTAAEGQPESFVWSEPMGNHICIGSTYRFRARSKYTNNNIFGAAFWSEWSHWQFFRIAHD